MCFWTKKVKTKQNIEHKNSCRRRELYAGPLASKADALPLQHRVNWQFLIFTGVGFTALIWLKCMM